MVSVSSKYQNQLKKLEIFYNSDFSLAPALQILGKQDFNRREFGFQIVYDENLKFVRNISFQNPKDLKNYILDKIPLSIYVGAIYSEGPDYRQQRSIHQLDWLKRELIFDLDLTEYDTVRPCSCKGKSKMCDQCWVLINVSMLWIHETLKQDFGIKNIQWIFSGRRGVHAWILDPNFQTLDSDQRAAIVDYLSFFKGDGQTAKFSPLAKDNSLYLERVNNLLYETYFREVTIEQLIDLGFNKQRAMFILNRRDKMGINSELLQRYVFVEEKVSKIVSSHVSPSRDEILNKILLNWSPRIDTAVTIDLRRILRLPGSIHGETGRLVRFIDEEEIEYFDPFREESIYQNN